MVYGPNFMVHLVLKDEQVDHACASLNQNPALERRLSQALERERGASASFCRPSPEFYYGISEGTKTQRQPQLGNPKNAVGIQTRMQTPR